MAYKADRLYRIDSTSSKDGWIAPIVSWFHGWRVKQSRKQDIKKLLAFNDRLLEDIGVLRSDLVRELGYDPRDRPPRHAVSLYPNHYLEKRTVITSNHAKRRK